MRILIADDDRITRKLLDTHLRNCGHDVVACSEGESAWHMLKKRNGPQLAILDWVMPGIDGVEICRRLRNIQTENYTYVILLTSKKGKENMVEGFDAGADDYVLKPFDPTELQMRVRVGARTIRLHEDLRSALKMSEFRASHDCLTGLWNRGAILDVLDGELSRVRRREDSLSIIMADIDFFKRINDRFGHLTGDAVLRGVSARLMALLRPYDSVGRYGGEEFLMVIPGCSTDDGWSVAERLRREFGDSPVGTSEGVFPVTLSLGVASVRPGRVLPADELIRRADVALYRAKEKGRNRVELGGQPEKPLEVRARGESTPFLYEGFAQ